MNGLEDALQAISAKFAGSFLGAAMALIFLPPKTRTEFVRRFVLALLLGLIFAEAARNYLGWPDTIEMQVASGAGVAMLSWFVFGAVVRIIGKWNPPGK